MFNIKLISASSGFGFVLSFLIRIISTHKFGTSFVYSIIFALIFAALGFAIDFVCRSFLNMSTPVVEPSSSKGGKKAGSTVNITIDDEGLTDDDNSPDFDIAKKASGLSKVADISDLKQSPVVKDAPASAEVVDEVKKENSPSVQKEVESPKPVMDMPKKENAANVPSHAKERAHAPEVERNAQSQEIDALPDIGSFGDDSESQNNELISNTDFSQAGSEKEISKPLVDASDALNHDSATIASAIRTLLKRDE